MGSDPLLAYINKSRQLFMRRRSRKDDNRPDLHSFDLKKAVLHQDGTTVCKPGRFKMEDAQKDMDDRYKSFTKDGIGTPFNFGKCKMWQTAKEELSMDTAHVCEDTCCHFTLDFWRQQWLLRGGVQRGGKEYAKTMNQRSLWCLKLSGRETASNRTAPLEPTV